MQRSDGEMGVNHAGALRVNPTLWGSLMQGRDNHRLGCQIRTSGSHLGGAEGEQPSLPSLLTLMSHQHTLLFKCVLKTCSSHFPPLCTKRVLQHANRPQSLLMRATQD